MDDVALHRFANLVAEVALQEELKLRRAAGEGIFFMPELAFAFAIGRAAASRSAEIFGEPGWTWQRETKVGDAGPVDLVFTKGKEGPRLLIEFKMRDTEQKYCADIEKLRGLADESEHLEDHFVFCALMDVWADKPFEDTRWAAIKRQGAELLEPVTFFSTKQDAYKRQIVCLVGVWKVA